MAQIEHVAGSAIRPFEYIPCGGHPIVSRAQESGRIEVPLDPHVLADRNPSAVQRDAPVDADHVAAGLPECVQEPRRSGPEVDRRDARLANSAEDLSGVRLRALTVVPRTQRARPAVEQLEGLRTRICLETKERRDPVREDIHESRPVGSSFAHEPFRRLEVTGGAAYDQVAGERERRPREPDQRHVEFRSEPRNRLPDERQTPRRVEGTESVHVLAGANRTVDSGTDAVVDSDRNAHRLQGNQEITEQDRGVDAEFADRLTGHLGRDCGDLDDLEDAVFPSDRPIRRRRTAGLTHEPDRCAVHGLPPTRPEESVVHPRNSRNASANASTVRSIASGPWAPETNTVSNGAGGR